MLLEAGRKEATHPLYSDPFKLSVILSITLAVGVVALLAINVDYQSSVVLGAAQIAAIGSLCFGLTGFVLGTARLSRSRPEHRRPMVYLAAITIAVLALHLYIINSPAASTGASLSGAVGTNLSDPQLRVASSLAGSTLTVDIAPVGSNAVSKVAVWLDKESLPGSGLSPLPTATSPLEPTVASPYGYPSSATGRWTVQATNSSVLRVDYQYLTCYHAPDTNDHRAVYGCIMDESYYVPSALAVLAGTQCAPYAPNCNLEHPPLAKAFIAAGIAVFGLNDFGWRVANVVMGTLSIPLLFVLCYSLTGSRRLSYFATLIFAADTLFFVHSSAALIDVPSVFFSLLGFIFYFRQSSWWKVNNYMSSGIFFGLSALSKETGVFSLAAVATYELFFRGSGPREAVRRAAYVAVPAFLVFAGGVQLYDSTLASSALPWFYQHINFMLSYGAGLKGGGWTDSGLGRYITPLDWLFVYSPVSYLVTNVVVMDTATGSTIKYVSAGYYGIANQVIVWMVLIWVPLALYRYLKGRRPEDVPNLEDRFAMFLTVWFLWSYIPYVALWVYGRVTYPFYFLPAIPALAAGAAYFITREWFPRRMAIVYLVAAFAIFFLYFPVKDFLPVFIRAWLAR